jgi:hypothetical protein
MASTSPTRSNHPSNPPSNPDPFDTLLTLEDTLYTTAYSSGVSAGSLAGRIEGRLFGLESGFEKFATLGALHGRSAVWGSRLLSQPTATTSPSVSSPSLAVKNEGVPSKEREDKQIASIPGLKSSSRLISNITLLHDLTDPDTFSTENTEEAVADFEDRVKRAGAKAKVVERIVGETEMERKEGSGKVDTGNMEDFSGGRGVRSREEM